MATEITVIVDTDSTQNPDYTSLSAAIIGESGDTPKKVTSADLVANNEQLTIECRASSGAADTTRVAVTGFTTDSTRFVRVTVPSAHRHDGKWNTAKYNLTTSGNWHQDVLYGFTAGHYRFEWMQVSTSAENSHVIECQPANSTVAEVRFTNCLLVHTHATSTRDVMRGLLYHTGAGTDHTLLLNNCVLAKAGTTGILFYNSQHSSYGQTYAYNCTFSKGAHALYRHGGGAATASKIVRNCIFTGQGTDIDDNGNLHVDYASYCTTDIETAQLDDITGGEDQVTYSFIDATAYDFRIDADATGAIDKGTDISANPDTAPVAPLSTDIVGTARPQGTAWDVGVFELIVATGPATPTNLQGTPSTDSILWTWEAGS